MPVNVTSDELRDIILACPWVNLITLEADTEPSWKSKKNDYVGKVFKRAVVNGFINWSYENSVNNQREREGLKRNFEAMPRAWGENVGIQVEEEIKRTPFILFNGECHSIAIKVERVLSEAFFSRETGEPISADVINPLLKSRNDSGRQGVEKAIQYRNYRLDHIRWLRFNGEVYVLT